MGGVLAGDAAGDRGFAPFLRAIGTGGVVVALLSGLPQLPVGLAAGLVVVCAIAALVNMRAGVVCSVLVVGLPLLYVSPILGALFILAGIVAMPALSMQDGAPFFLLGGTTVAVMVHAEWAIPVLAGLYLATGEAVVVGAVAAIGIELAGLLMGERFIASVVTHGTSPLLKLAMGARPNLTELGWIMQRYNAVPPGSLAAGVVRGFSAVAMLVQPLLWGGTAAVVSAIPKPDLKMRLLAAAAGLGMLFVGTNIVLRLPGTAGPGVGILATTLAASVVVIAAVAGIVTIARKSGGGAAAGAPIYYAAAPLAEQVPRETDVVDLLRTISHAEEQIRTQFTQNATILLSDMKEFSRMTHEQGSIPSAKTVQRHRDQLMPVIQQNGGTAKPTGGDGIIAAFPDARSAIQGAVDMQSALAYHNAQATADTQVMIRIGINTGEVVFDKDGTPFIGDGLNMSARVMGLADGGQILVSKSTLEEAMEMGEFKWQYLGTRDFKGVAVGAHIYEILWHEQTPAPASGPVAYPPDPVSREPTRE